jgi:hypothetical protein
MDREFAAREPADGVSHHVPLRIDAWARARARALLRR